MAQGSLTPASLFSPLYIPVKFFVAGFDLFSMQEAFLFLPSCVVILFPGVFSLFCGLFSAPSAPPRDHLPFAGYPCFFFLAGLQILSPEARSRRFSPAILFFLSLNRFL